MTKRGKAQDKPAEVTHNGRKFVPIARNGYFHPSYLYRHAASGIMVDGIAYKVAMTLVPGKSKNKLYRYVCKGDVERVVRALRESDKSPARSLVIRYIMERVAFYSTHHCTYSALISSLRAKLGLRLSRSFVTDVVAVCRMKEPTLLIGLPVTDLVVRMIEEQPDLRMATPLYDTLRRIGEKRFGRRLSKHILSRAIHDYDEVHGHPTEFVDKEKWATMEEAMQFLGIAKNTILGKRYKFLEVIGLYCYGSYVSWESLRAYKERRDAYVAKYNPGGRVQGMADSEQEFSAK